MSTNLNPNQAVLDKSYRGTVIIFGAQIATAFLLGILAFLFAPAFDVATLGVDPTTLWFVLLFVAIGSFLLRRLFMNWERLRNVALLKGIEGVLATLRTNAILFGLLGEIVVVIGAVIAAMSGNVFDLIRAGLIALVVFGVNFPRKRIWQTVVAGLEKV